MSTGYANYQVSKKYSVIYADLPWEDEEWRNKFRIQPVQTWLAAEALVLLWIPMPLLGTGLVLLADWGFDYAGTLAWKMSKDDLESPSLYGQCEFVLVGKIGCVKPPSLLRHNHYEAAGSGGNYKPQGFRRLLYGAGFLAFGESATYLDLCGVYWAERFPDYSKGQWDWLEG